MFLSRNSWLRLAGLVGVLLLCFSCSAGSKARIENSDRGRSATISGDGECRTSTLDADGTSDDIVVEAGIGAQNPIVGYVPRTVEILWWHAPPTFQAHGEVNYVAQEGIGHFEFVADSDRTIRVTSVSPSTPSPSTLLHITSFSLKWRVTSASQATPAPSIGIRVRVSPFQDGGTNRCLIYTCDPETGPQVCSPAPAGTLCSDGNSCNGLETCDGEGACVAGTNLADGTSCSDGNACNGEEKCSGGACTAGTPLTPAQVDDHNACTVDACDPARGGIVNEPIPGCQSTAGAPPVEQKDLTEKKPFGASTEFLYKTCTGCSPVQTGVAPGTINKDRAAVVRGRVFGPDGVTPASGVTVTILRHPEYGQTLTRTDGWYDLAVNGGGPLVVNIAGPGALPIQRHVTTTTLGWSVVDDVVLTVPETSADTFTPGSPVAQVVRGSTTPAGADADPARRAMVYFPANRTIQNFTPPPGPLAVQITEYTGANGPRRMPGELAPNIGYTYAVEVGFPAAVAAEVDHVEFNDDVMLYVNNFTGSPVGTTVPIGYYDRSKGAWLGEKSGRIVKILRVTGGLAELDVTGDDVADGTAALTALGIDADEQAMLATEYQPGTQLWRSALRHFSPWDCNWGFGPPIDAIEPPAPDPDDETPPDSTKRCGSIIGCEARTLGEAVPIVGTPFSLHYQSERNRGFRGLLKVRVSDDRELPNSLLGAHIHIQIAGQVFRFGWSAPFPKNSHFHGAWNGTDAYGRRVPTGTYEAKVRIGYEFGGTSTRSTSSFGVIPGAVITGERAARTVTLWKEASYQVSIADVEPLGFGGWTLSANHVADGENLTLYRGDGNHDRITSDAASVVETIAGTSYTGTPNWNENGSAKQAWIGTVTGLARAPDGTIYIAGDGYNLIDGGRIRVVGPDGNIKTVAGLPPTAPKIDGGAALNARVFPTGMALGPDGSIYFSEYNGHQVWRIAPGPNPTIHHVAGDGVYSPGGCVLPASCGDGGRAVDAKLAHPRDLTVADDGTIFLVDAGHNRVVRIGPEGTISTYLANAGGATRLALRKDGVLFVLDNDSSIIRANPDGSAQRILKQAPNVFANYYTDWCGQQGGAHDGFVVPLADGSFILPCINNVLRRTPYGITQRIAGPAPGPSSVMGFAGDGDAPFRAKFSDVERVVLGDRGELFVADKGNWRIRRIAPSPYASLDGVHFVIPSKDRSEIYEMDAMGRHLRTLSSLKGSPRYVFGYDGATGQLASVRDFSGEDLLGNVTSIARSGSQVTVTAPGGQVTTLGLDANGYLASITNPNAELTQVSHTSDGLLTDLVGPRGNAHHFEYDFTGRLVRDTDASPGSPGTRLVKTSDLNGWDVEIQSPEGRVTRHRVDRRGSFSDTGVRERRTVTMGSSLQTTTETYSDGGYSSTYPDGTKLTVRGITPDPRWGAAGGFASSVQLDVGHPVTTHSMTRTESRTATLATAGQPFSVSGQTITATRSGSGLPSSVATSVFTAGPPAKWTMTSAAGRQVELTLDSFERVAQVAVLGSSPVTLHPVQFRYDGRGRVDQVTWGTRVYGVDYNATTGWIDSTSAPAAGLGLTYDSRDANGRPTLITLPGARQLALSYDAAGNVSSITPPSKPAHAFSFDPSDRLAGYVPPNVVPSLSPKDTAYSRDLDGLPILASHPGKPVNFVYDDVGRLRQSMGAVTTTYTRDTLGRLASIATTDDVTLTNTYDGALLTQQAVSGPFSRALNKTYDNFLRVSSVDVDGANSVSASYDGDDRVTVAAGMAVTWSPNGLLTDTSIGSVSDSFSFNGYGELANHAVTAATTAYSATYVRDAAGRIHEKTESVGVVTHSYRYEYAAAGRLWQVYVDGAATPTREWTYDANGNRSGGTYDAQDRLTELDGVSYIYANNGELAKKVAGASETVFSYDAHGNLRTVTPPAGPPITYIVDGQNRRIGKKVGGSLVQGFIYDGSRIIAELDATGAVVARFVYATQRHSPDLVLKGGSTYRIVKDHLGSPRLVVNASTGAVVQQLDYDEWGNTTESGTIGFQPFGFAGGLWDRDTNLVRFGARDYDPTTGRWASKDVSRFGGGLNFYAYAENDPVNFVDPTGFKTEVVFWEPVGYGASSFGHVSIIVNGESFSWGPSGVDIRAGVDYLAMNQQFRSGRGLLLDLSPQEEDELRMQFAAMAGQSYSALKNNCTDPVERGLSSAGRRDPVLNALLPTGVARSLNDLAIGQTYYPGPARSPFGPPWSVAARNSFWSMY